MAKEEAPSPTIYFIDIETVPEFHYRDVPKSLMDLFLKRNSIEQTPDVLPSGLWEMKAGLQAEFGKIICISMAAVRDDEVLIKTFHGRHEKELLTRASEVLNRAMILCAHNGKEFDFPFLFRRFVINDLPVPPCLQIIGKKPWEIPHLDTMELWGHMQWKYRVSLDLLAHILGLESPKADIDGSQISELYYSMFDGVKSDELPFDKEQEVMGKIAEYCSRDAMTVLNIYRKFKKLEPLKSYRHV